MHNVWVKSMKIWIDNTTLSKAILLMKSKLFVGAQWCSKSTAGSCVGSNAAAELCIKVLTMFSNICGVRFKSTPLCGESVSKNIAIVQKCPLKLQLTNTFAGNTFADNECVFPPTYFIAHLFNFSPMC